MNLQLINNTNQKHFKLQKLRKFSRIQKYEKFFSISLNELHAIAFVKLDSLVLYDIPGFVLFR